jgi:hypothetical protein
MGEKAEEEVVKGQQAGEHNPDLSPREKKTLQAPPLARGAHTA